MIDVKIKMYTYCKNDARDTTSYPKKSSQMTTHLKFFMFQARPAFGAMRGVLGSETRRCSLLYVKFWFWFNLGIRKWHGDRKGHAFYLPRMHSNVAWQRIDASLSCFFLISKLEAIHSRLCNSIDSGLVSYEVGISMIPHFLQGLISSTFTFNSMVN